MLTLQILIQVLVLVLMILHLMGVDVELAALGVGLVEQVLNVI